MGAIQKEIILCHGSCKITIIKFSVIYCNVMMPFDSAQILLGCLETFDLIGSLFVLFFPDNPLVPWQSVCLPKLMVLNSSLVIRLGKTSLDLDVLYRSIVHSHVQKSQLVVQVDLNCKRLLYLPMLNKQGTSILGCQFLYLCNVKRPDLPG